MRTTDIIAQMAGCSHGTVKNVKFILASGDLDIIARCRDGSLSINGGFLRAGGLNKSKKHITKDDIRDAVEGVIERTTTPSLAENYEITTGEMDVEEGLEAEETPDAVTKAISAINSLIEKVYKKEVTMVEMPIELAMVSQILHGNSPY